MQARSARSLWRISPGQDRAICYIRARGAGGWLGGSLGEDFHVGPGAARTMFPRSQSFRAHHDARSLARFINVHPVHFRLWNSAAAVVHGQARESLLPTSLVGLLIKTYWPTLTVMLARKCSFPVRAAGTPAAYPRSDTRAIFMIRDTIFRGLCLRGSDATTAHLSRAVAEKISFSAGKICTWQNGSHKRARPAGACTEDVTGSSYVARQRAGKIIGATARERTYEPAMNARFGPARRPRPVIRSVLTGEISADKVTTWWTRRGRGGRTPRGNVALHAVNAFSLVSRLDGGVREDAPEISLGAIDAIYA